ncbi:MAG: hypothetical protein E7463_09690 [Ruminococcaceae bacterium]|nr:hypothetical protein [Oscillospiraceae bacterium]
MGYKKRWGDRKDGRRLRSIEPMSRLTSYIMVNRNGASNYMAERLEITQAEKYIREKRAQGLKGFGMLHLILAAYVRTVSQRPGLNRYIGGQEVYARDNIVIAMVIKKEMKLDAPETVIKLEAKPDATAADIYEGMNRLISDNRSVDDESSFDNLAKLLNYIPRPVLKFTIWFLKLLDYYNKLPMALQNLSPFHASFFITSMGSLGIPAIFHHLYDFGNVPIFLSYGAKYSENKLGSDGSVTRHNYIDMKMVLDERTCDGHYYASSLKYMKDIFKHPEVLDNPPETVVEDIE